MGSRWEPGLRPKGAVGGIGSTGAGYHKWSIEGRAAGPQRRAWGERVDTSKLDRVVAEARKAQTARERDYREQALKLYPWVCARCGRTFDRPNLSELTVHHKNHDHDHNPADGSNWELLCLYCHDNEHQRQLEAQGLSAPGAGAGPGKAATHQPFAALKDLLRSR